MAGTSTTGAAASARRRLDDRGRGRHPGPGDRHQAVRTGAAAGALNVTRHGLGTGHADAIRVLTDRVELTPIED